MAPTCPECNSEFNSWQKLRFHYTSEHGESLPNRVCETCGCRFYSEDEQTYCSRDCYWDDVSFEGANNPNYRDAKETICCEICGDEFDYYPSEKEGLYCSDCVETEEWRHTVSLEGEENPRWNGGPLDLECDVCGESFERRPGNVTTEAVFCGEACRREWLSEAFTGEGHPNWRGGGNGPYGKGWADVRRRALERDGYECVVCGTTREELGRNPDVHHIVPVRVFVESDDWSKEDAHYLENVVTLCPSCHRRAEFGQLERGGLRSAVQNG